MAEENEVAPVAVVAETDTPVKTEVKKERAPRRKKVVAEPASVTSEALTEASPATVDGRPKRGRPKSGEAMAAVGKSRLKGAARKKQSEQAAKHSAPAIDELADLIQLEEENKRLRKTLAEKLRQENADLRKRLGLG